MIWWQALVNSVLCSEVSLGQSDWEGRSPCLTSFSLVRLAWCWQYSLRVSLALQILGWEITVFVEVPVSPILFYAWLDPLGCHQFYHYHLCLLASLSVPWSTTNSKVPDLSRLSCPWVVGPPFRWSLVLLGVSVVQSARHVVSPKGLGRIRVLVLSIFPDLMIGIRWIRRRCWSDTEVLRARDWRDRQLWGHKNLYCLLGWMLQVWCLVSNWAAEWWCHRLIYYLEREESVSWYWQCCWVSIQSQCRIYVCLTQPLHVVPLCTVPLCTVPLCMVPLCTVPLCTVPLCTVLLCMVPLCTTHIVSQSSAC